MAFWFFFFFPVVRALFRGVSGKVFCVCKGLLGVFQESHVVLVRVSGFTLFLKKKKKKKRPVNECGVEPDSRMDNPGRAA